MAVIAIGSGGSSGEIWEDITDQLTVQGYSGVFKDGANGQAISSSVRGVRINPATYGTKYRVRTWASGDSTAPFYRASPYVIQQNGAYFSTRLPYEIYWQGSGSAATCFVEFTVVVPASATALYVLAAEGYEGDLVVERLVE